MSGNNPIVGPFLGAPQNYLPAPRITIKYTPPKPCFSVVDLRNAHRLHRLADLPLS